MDNLTKSNTPDIVSQEDISYHLSGCAQNNRESQKTIYKSFYGYAMAICMSHTTNHEDAVEILNDGFLKIFRKINDFKPAYTDVMSSFKGWVRRIMVRTAIDHFRKNRRHKLNTDLTSDIYENISVNEEAMYKLTRQEIINALQHLSPAYRKVFSLFVFDGLKHKEISKKLNISSSVSRAYLLKARQFLQTVLHIQKCP